MGVEGIGASVLRKEVRRFTTGKGRYVDDIKLQGMTHAHFVRSPHGHAKVKGIDSSAAPKISPADCRWPCSFTQRKDRLAARQSRRKVLKQRSRK